MRWGQGSLQEIDHVPIVRPLTKMAATPEATAEIPGLVDEALRVACTPHTGPTFLDFPLDYVFMEGAEPDEPAALPQQSWESRCSSTAWRADACPPTTSTRWPRSCVRRRATTKSSRPSAGTESSSRRPTTCDRPSSGQWAPAGPPSST